MKRILAVLLFSFASQSLADSGNELLSRCTSTVSADSTYCMRYISGHTDTQMNSDIDVHIAKNKNVPISVLQDSPDKEYLSYCLPKGATKGQLKDVFIKYANEHPEERHKPASMPILPAFETAFPCK